MNMKELKKYLGAFALCVTFVFALAAIAAGAVTVSARVQKAIYGTEYPTVSIDEIFYNHANIEKTKGTWYNQSKPK